VYAVGDPVGVGSGCVRSRAPGAGVRQVYATMYGLTHCLTVYGGVYGRCTEGVQHGSGGRRSVYGRVTGLGAGNVQQVYGSLDPGDRYYVPNIYVSIYTRRVSP